MSEVKKIVLVPKELWETRQKRLSEPSCKIYKKRNSSEKKDRPIKKLKTDLESHYKKNPETLKALKEIYENKRLKFSLVNTIIVNNNDAGVDIKTFIHSIKLKNAAVDPN